MLALDPGSNHLAEVPFPHLVLEQALPAELFAVLQATYPVCPPASGPTGHTIHRGDALFEAQMAAHPAWRDLYDYCNCPEFMSRLAKLFAAEIDRSCAVTRDALHFVDHIETRAEKEMNRIPRPALSPEAMFVRFDFMQGKESYTREAHCDHRRRLATMLLYFDAPGPDTFEGGALVFHDEAGSPAVSIAPAENSRCVVRVFGALVAFSRSGNPVHPPAPLRPGYRVGLP